MRFQSQFRLVVLTVLVLVAFIANSLLCRVALASRAMSIVDFTCIRLLSGAVVLWLLLRVKDGRTALAGSWASALVLFGYAACFSLSYTSLSAGTGALLLFGAVQCVMIAWGLYRGERLSVWQWLGAVLSPSWFSLACRAGCGCATVVGATQMAAAGVCWAAYSLRGQGSKDPTAETAGNFVRAVPFAFLLYVHPHVGKRSCLDFTVWQFAGGGLRVPWRRVWGMLCGMPFCRG